MKKLPGTDDKSLGAEPQAVSFTLQRRNLGSWQLWIGILFSLGFLFLAMRDVDLRQTANALRRVNGLILIAAVVNSILSIAIKAFRWRLLLSANKAPSFVRSFSIFSIGVMMNTFLPARVGDFARAYLMGEVEEKSKVYVLGTVVVEKVTDLLFLLLSLVVLLSQMVLPEWLGGSARGMALVLAFLIPSLALFTWQREFILRFSEWVIRFFPIAWREWLGKQIHNGLTSLEVVRQPRLIIGLFGISLLVWIVSAFTNYLVFLALGLTLPFWSSLLLLAVLQVGASVPSSPGRVGVFQYLVILTLSVVAVDKNVALGYSIVLYLVVYIPIVIIGSFCLWREKITWQKLTEGAVLLNHLRKGEL